MTPSKPMRSPKQGQQTPNSARKRSRTSTWRRPINWGPSQPENIIPKVPLVDNKYKSMEWRHYNSPPLIVDDDIGDLEWVW